MMSDAPSPPPERWSGASGDPARHDRRERRTLALVVGVLLLGFMAGLALLLHALSADWQR